MADPLDNITQGTPLASTDTTQVNSPDGVPPVAPQPPVVPPSQDDINNAFDFLNNKIDPTLGQTVVANYQNGFTGPIALGSNILEREGLITGEENVFQQGYEINNRIANSATGVFKNLAGFAANIAGSLTNPLTWVVGGPTLKLGAKAGSAAFAAFDIGTENAATQALIRGVSGGVPAGVVGIAPYAVDDNYQAASNTLDKMGMVKELSQGAGLGFALGTIPFARALLKEKGIDKPVESAADADEAIKTYNTNESVSSDGQNANVQMASENSVNNFSSVLADMMSSDGEFDPDTLKATMGSDFAKIYNDPQMQNILNDTIAQLDQTHMQFFNSMDLNDADHPNLVSAISNNFPDLKPDEDGGLINAVTEPYSDAATKLMSLDPNSLGDDGSSISKLQGMADLKQRATDYSSRLGFLKKMQSLFNEDYNDQTMTGKLNDYVAKAALDSQPEPLEALKGDGKGTKANEEPADFDPDTADPDAKGIKNDYDQNELAMDSLKSKNKIFKALMSCIKGNG